MESKVAYNAFFALLRAGLWNREPDGGCFPLSPDVWKKIYRLARKQTVEGIVYDGIMQLSDACFPPKDLLMEWVIRLNSIENDNKRMNRIIGEIRTLFAKNHIAALLVKGQGVAASYDNPLHRVCGDIDWSFPDKENFDRANSLMKRKRIKIRQQAGFSTYYVYKGVLVEHHRHLLDISNPFLSGYLRRIQQQEEALSAYMDAWEQKIPLPSPVLTHLSVNSHILKHLLAFGISLRQLCDSARVCSAYHSRTEAELLKEIYHKLGIYPWIQLLNRLLVDYLGMPEEYLLFPPAPHSKADFMIKDVLQGGSFGFYGGPFSKETDIARVRRKHVWLQLLVRWSRYVRYAPW
ncbi:MAG: nucleotidyltransferase family protein, partial [Dysgonamonadaceae bacterium]|nr:nucleotidyltransferase family protein [Dysgonamonadaceae bacterium]